MVETFLSILAAARQSFCETLWVVLMTEIFSRIISDPEYYHTVLPKVSRADT